MIIISGKLIPGEEIDNVISSTLDYIIKENNIDPTDFITKMSSIKSLNERLDCINKTFENKLKIIL